MREGTRVGRAFGLSARDTVGSLRDAARRDPRGAATAPDAVDGGYQPTVA